jgi:hypothetical protein
VCVCVCVWSNYVNLESLEVHGLRMIACLGS